MELRYSEHYKRWADASGNIYRDVKGQMLQVTPRLKRDGYLHVHTPTHSQAPAHRVVADAWIPNPEGKRTVDHINRDRTDNRVENLRWATYPEQQANTSVSERLNATYGCTPMSIGQKEWDRLMYRENTEYHERKLEGARKNAAKHYSRGETYHSCPDGHRRWHKPGECPACKLS